MTAMLAGLNLGRSSLVFHPCTTSEFEASKGARIEDKDMFFGQR